jgi:epoxide hydrolase 4
MMRAMDLPAGLTEGYADLREVRLHYVEAGEGPLVVLLHGFPEFWYGWRHQIPALAARGFRVVAPDLRGYNTSSKPRDVAAYDAERLAGDVRDLVRERGEERCFLAGHDWGAVTAYATAGYHPEAVEKLAILNVPHPRRMLEGWRTTPRQLAKSWYMFFFQLPVLPERLAAVRSWAAFRRGLDTAKPGAFTEEDLARYREAWSQPHAATTMINYYRAALRQAPWKVTQRLRVVEAPTMVIWGEDDAFLESSLAEPDRRDVPNFEGVVRLPGASHFVQHDEPERVTALLADFFGRPA